MTIKQKCLQLLFVAVILTSGIQGLTSNLNELSNKERRSVIDTISTLLQNEYIGTELTSTIIDSLNSKFEAGRYNDVSPHEFAYRVTIDLFEASNDRHFYIQYNPELALLECDLNYGTLEEKRNAHEKLRLESSSKNFGFHKVERLKGNIGYLDFRSFDNPKYGAETAIAALQFLSHCDAIIFDLRKNHGGFSAMVRLISSYFFEDERLLRTFVFKSGKEDQGWTLPYVPGRKLYDKKLYILTSNETGSAAEAFSYFMKHTKRATLIGETTRGAAHNVRHAILIKKFIFYVPDKKPIEPNTLSNWERVGVEPHIKIDRDLAYDKAYQMIADELVNDSQSKDKFELEWVLCSLNEKTNRYSYDDINPDHFTGTYENKIIYKKKGKLYYQFSKEKTFELKPLSTHIFKIIGIDDIRLKFIEENNTIVKMEIIYDDGWKFVKMKNTSN